MLISREAMSAYMDRELDDLSWMKKLTRERILRELDNLKVKPKFKTNPWTHQLVCFYIGLLYPRYLFLLDMGLGKSKIISDLITQIQRERKLEGALITVPRKINIESWQDDLARHSDLEPWPINVVDIEEKWERLICPRGDVTLIDNQGLQWALCKKNKKTGKLAWDEHKVELLMRQYNFVDIDEIHKYKSHDNLWHRFMNQISKRAEFMYGNTGTLFGKNVEDIWSQFYLIDRGDTFGENLGLFRKCFFQTKSNGFAIQYHFDKQMDAELNRFIKHRSIRYDENEVPEAEVPRMVPRELKLNMGEEQREHYLRALEGLINAGGSFEDIDAAWLRMRQIMSGYLAWNDDHGKHVLPFKENPKLDALESLIDGMGDSKIVVAYDYTETGRIIVDRVKSMGLGYEWFYGGTKDQAASRRRFMEDPKCRVFVMNSVAGGTGNDGLQKVARYMVLYETPTNPIDRQQTIKRIHRPGQTQRSFVYDLVMRRSIDRGILDDIKEGMDTHAAVVNGRIRNKAFFLRDA